MTDAFSLIPEKANIRIYNDLGSGINLTVHCKSKDDDLGEQHLGYRNYFEFRFRPSIFQNTLFYCSFQWNGRTQWFNIYVELRDEPYCSKCMWNIRPDGPCLANYNNLCLPWYFY
ncbi:hypothetical protein V6N11_072959 [Hibiscus sabdariffa]|uniref:S-protein homolog n=1 Tax=Hibiscus sabdariffa TaxID=183260 RepID=A0ABR2NWZ6_9ROSI